MSTRPSAGLRRAQRMLKKRCEPHDWFSGVGVAPASGSLGLRVNVKRRPSAGQVPSTYYGYPVEVVVMRRVSARQVR